MYTAVCAHALFPLHERLKGHDSVAVRELLERSQWWPRDAIEKDHVARLRLLFPELEAVEGSSDVLVLGSDSPAVIDALASLACPDQMVVDLVSLPPDMPLKARVEGLCW